MPEYSRSNKAKHAVRVSPGLLIVCAALAIMLVTSFACGSTESTSGGATAETGVSQSGSPSDRFDLSGLDAATTEADIIRLLGEGYVMYTKLVLTRKAVFAPGGIFIDAPGCIGQMRSIPQVVCEGYPETIVEEWWESTDSLGIVDAYYGRMTTLEGTLLATGIQGEWTDIASGEKWSVGQREGREIARDVEIAFNQIEKKYASFGIGADSRYMDRPSVIFSLADEYIGGPNINFYFTDGESEYRVANPLMQRHVSWLDNDDGTRETRSESRVIDFAMLPPGSLPDFVPPTKIVELDVPNLDSQFDLSGMDAAATRAEIIRLLGEGHVMYLRMEMFNLGGASSLACGPPSSSRPQVVCDGYPGRIVREIWQITDASGIVNTFYGRESKLDGTVLATGIQGEWTHVKSGETWSANLLTGSDVLRGVEGAFTVIERGLGGVESEYLGRPSVIFGDVFEYQVANSFLQRQIRWHERGDGTRYMSSEVKFTAFAMLPPGSFPDFATTSSGE